MDGQLPALEPTPTRRKLRRDFAEAIGDLIPASDVVSVLLAACAASAAAAAFDPGQGFASVLAGSGHPLLAALVLAPLVLGGRRFLSGGAPAERAALFGLCYGVRLVALLAALGALGAASGLWAAVPGAWPATFLAALALGTATARAALLRGAQALERSGALNESVAVLGSGDAADRMLSALRASRARLEVVGVFDDRGGRRDGARHRRDGTVADLIELGKRRELDWIVLALPDAAEARVQALRHRLMSLATPIAALAAHAPLPPRPALLPRGIVRKALARSVPHWLHALVRCPYGRLRRRVRQTIAAARAPRPKLRLELDRHGLDEFGAIAERFGQTRYGYVVTANVDHVIRMHRWPALRKLYAESAYALLDSRFLAHLLRAVRGLVWPVCAGSDLTARLLQDAGGARDRIVLIGGSEAQAKRLAARYGLRRLVHYNPPMGFIRDPAQIEACLAFIERHSPFRYCLLAVGSPQQEFLAYCLKQRGAARGLALCIGASVDFLTGKERRAPAAFQALGCEWLFRLLQSPRRMAYRYLVRGPRIFALLQRTELASRGAEPVPIMDLPDLASISQLSLEIAAPRLRLVATGPGRRQDEGQRSAA